MAVNGLDFKFMKQALMRSGPMIGSLVYAV